jgi:hypothetical protein
MGATEFASSLRARTLDPDRYVGYLATSYPLVIAFNRGLIASMAKLDPGSDVRLIKGLCHQVIEELDHNDLWRAKLDAFGINHGLVYERFRAYSDGLTVEEVTAGLTRIAAALEADPRAVSPGAFPNAPFPEPVVALYHHVSRLGSDPRVTYSEQYAAQFAIEVAVVEVVSGWVYPGAVGHPDLDRGPATLAWWREHATAEALGRAAGTADEERHQELARAKLDTLSVGPEYRAVVLRQVEVTLRLLVASMQCHDRGLCRFSPAPYRRPDPHPGA